MIYSLRGRLIYNDTSSAVIECGGVGYRCTVTYNTLRELPQKGEELMLFTYMSVREDAVDLFGFMTTDELDWFKRLISVNGVGPKIAIPILSELSPDKLTLAVASGDIKAITRAKGVGSKLAQRIVLELKDKVAKTIGSAADSSNAFSGADAGGGVLNEAIAALISLGYSQSEAAAAVSGQDLSQPVEAVIHNALKKLF